VLPSSFFVLGSWFFVRRSSLTRFTSNFTVRENQST
jgi:hypothetical protein